MQHCDTTYGGTGKEGGGGGRHGIPRYAARASVLSDRLEYKIPDYVSSCSIEKK